MYIAYIKIYIDSVYLGSYAGIWLSPSADSLRVLEKPVGGAELLLQTGRSAHGSLLSSPAPLGGSANHDSTNLGRTLGGRADGLSQLLGSRPGRRVQGWDRPGRQKQDSTRPCEAPDMARQKGASAPPSPRTAAFKGPGAASPVVQRGLCLRGATGYSCCYCPVLSQA